jgi:hypothetical protein
MIPSSWSNGAFISGTLDGGGGDDTYTINLSSTGAGTTTIKDSGTTGTDSLTVNGTATADILTLTESYIAQSSQIVNYSGEIENLTVETGKGSDRITVSAPVTLTGNLSLSTGLDEGEITVNGAINAGSIKLDSSNITTSFNGSLNTNAAGGINLTGNNFTLNGAILATGGGKVTATANNNITTSDITANRGIILTSKTGAVETGNLNSQGVTGGSITIEARDRITTGTINSSASLGDGGDVFLDPENDIQVVSINAQGGTEGRGGKVDITTQRFLPPSNPPPSTTAIRHRQSPVSTPDNFNRISTDFFGITPSSRNEMIASTEEDITKPVLDSTRREEIIRFLNSRQYSSGSPIYRYPVYRRTWGIH